MRETMSWNMSECETFAASDSFVLSQVSATPTFKLVAPKILRPIFLRFDPYRVAMRESVESSSSGAESKEGKLAKGLDSLSSLPTADTARQVSSGALKSDVASPVLVSKSNAPPRSSTDTVPFPHRRA